MAGLHRWTVLVVAAIWLLGSSGRTGLAAPVVSQPPLTPPSVIVPADSSLDNDPISRLRIWSRQRDANVLVVEKKRRRMTLYVSGYADTTFHIGLGFSPRGDKVRQGDGRTPEGLFRIGVRTDYPHSRYYRSMMINYPLPEHADYGLEHGLIDEATHREILDAHAARAMPRQNTRLGGDICIHGHGGWRDWTLGCVAVGNQDMDYLFEHLRVGDLCLIVK